MILTVDIGTSILKCGIFNQSCRLINQSSIPVKLSSENGFFETDPSDWIEAFKKNCRKMPECRKIKYIVISGNGPTLSAVGKNGKVLYPAVNWLDTRGIDEVKAEIKNSNVNTSYFLSKAYWIFKNKPGIYSKIKYFISCPEYLIYYLTKNAFTFLPNKGFKNFIWTEKAISSLGMDKEKFPPFISPCKSAGKINKNAAREFDINPEAEIITGSYDFHMSLLGTGTVAPGTACDRTGTSEGINYCSSRQIKDKSLLCTPHIDENFYNVSGVISASGKVFEWYKNNSPYYNKNYNELYKDVEKIKPGAGNLIFLPHIAGTRNTENNDSGAFLGLTASHTYRDMARAVIESIGFAVNSIIEIIESHGPVIKDLRIAGSLSEINILNRIKADITGKKVLVPEISDSELLGNACVGLVYSGEYKDLIEASSNCVKIKKIIKPDSRLFNFYKNMYNIYKTAHEKLIPVFNQLKRHN